MRIILLVFFLSGCAVGVLTDNMQPDGSYRILTSGGCLASKGDTEKGAEGHATQLCPGGYDTKSVISDSAGCHPRTQLIVKCH